jgi:BlaI family penicillinase repressor
MDTSRKLSRRERQIMDILYALEGATVLEVQAKLDDAPTDMAVRRLLHILEEKGHVKRHKRSREFVYVPKQSKSVAGRNALQQVLDTFFGGAVDEALGEHLFKGRADVSDEQLERMRGLIDQAKNEGR